MSQLAKVADEATERDPQKQTVYELIRRQTPQINMALPKHITADAFTRIVLTEVRATPQLLRCEPMSLLASIMLAAQLGLEPGRSLGLSWIIPYYNSKNKVYQAQFQIGAEGYRELAYRSGKVATIQPRIVYAADDFAVEYGAGGTKWHHKPSEDVPGDWTHVYVAVELANGSEMFDYMPKSHVIAHRDRYVREWNKPGSAWVTNEAEMGRKTVMKRASKQLPKSREIVQALVADESTPMELSADIAGALAFAERELPDDLVAASEIIDVESEEVPEESPPAKGKAGGSKQAEPVEAGQQELVKT